MLPGQDKKQRYYIPLLKFLLFFACMQYGHIWRIPTSHHWHLCSFFVNDDDNDQEARWEKKSINVCILNEDTSQDLVHKSDFILTFSIINSDCRNTTDTKQSGTSIKTELARLGLVEQPRTQYLPTFFVEMRVSLTWRLNPY